MNAARALWPWLAAAAGGAMLSQCFPPWNIEALVWVWMLPLLAALWYSHPFPAKRRMRRGALLGYVAGLVFFLVNLKWLYQNDRIPGIWIIVFQLYLSLFFAAFGAFAATIGRLRDDALLTRSEDGMSLAKRLWQGSQANLRVAVLNAVAWTGLEWLRGWLFTGFGWNGLGVAFHDNLILAQPADIVGVTGLSFLVVFCASIALGTLRRFQLELGRRIVMRPHFDFGIAILLVIACFFYGVRTGIPKGPDDGDGTIEVKTLLVQGNIPQDQKWDPELIQENYDAYARLSRLGLETQEVDLVIWPESAVFLPFYEGFEFHEEYFAHLFATQDFTLMTGINEDAVGEGLFNSLYALRGDLDDFANYRKVHLVPFGEFFPFRESIPGLDKLADMVMLFDFSPGESTEPLALSKPMIEIIPTICFEDTIGRLARKFVRDAPQLIVNVTNDGWFKESEAAEQHLANARFRAIELRRPMARSANTGVTCIIDAHGRIKEHHLLSDAETGSIFIDGFLASTIRVPKAPPRTVYARFGDWFSIACLLATIVAVVMVRQRKRDRSSR